MDEDFREACRSGNVVEVQYFIERGINNRSNERKTGLHYAVCHGHIDVAKVLIRNGADVNAVDKR